MTQKTSVETPTETRDILRLGSHHRVHCAESTNLSNESIF